MSQRRPFECFSSMIHWPEMIANLMACPQHQLRIGSLHRARHHLVSIRRGLMYDPPSAANASLWKVTPAASSSTNGQNKVPLPLYQGDRPRCRLTLNSSASKSSPLIKSQPKTKANCALKRLTLGPKNSN